MAVVVVHLVGNGPGKHFALSRAHKYRHNTNTNEMIVTERNALFLEFGVHDLLLSIDRCQLSFDKCTTNTHTPDASPAN